MIPFVFLSAWWGALSCYLCIAFPELILYHFMHLFLKFKTFSWLNCHFCQSATINSTTPQTRWVLSAVVVSWSHIAVSENLGDGCMKIHTNSHFIGYSGRYRLLPSLILKWCKESYVFHWTWMNKSSFLVVYIDNNKNIISIL